MNAALTFLLSTYSKEDNMVVLEAQLKATLQYQFLLNLVFHLEIGVYFSDSLNKMGTQVSILHSFPGTACLLTVLLLCSEDQQGSDMFIGSVARYKFKFVLLS